VPGDLPRDTYIRADPLLAAGPDGVQRLQPGSPALDAVTDEFAKVQVDMEGQSRSGKLDTGADEFSVAPVVARILTPADVGPMAR
jgi:poly(beta-D-mannuronate) lyase